MNAASQPRVLFVTTGLGTGGAEMMLCQLVAGLGERGFHSGVVSLTDGGKHETRLRAMNVPVTTLGMRPARPTAGGLFRLVRAILSARPGVIAGWMYHGNLAALLGKWLAGCRAPVVWNVRQSLDALHHEKPGSAAVIRLCARLSRFASAVAYNSQASARHHEIAGYCREKTVLTPNGFDIAAFAPSAEARSAVRAELGLAPGTLLVGRFGRYAPMKDHAAFLRAAAMAAAAEPRARFLLAGTGLGPENRELAAQINQLGLASRALLLGERTDMPRLTASLDVACSSSAFGEGCPNVVGEAMACGVPCAVTDVGDSAWLAGGLGRVVPPCAPEALAGAVLELLALPDAARRELGGRCREHIAKNFSLDAVIDRFSRLLSGGAPATPNPRTTPEPCAA